jgi:hypothetical protein
VFFYLNNRVRAIHLLVKLLARLASSKSLRRNVYFIFYYKIRLSMLLISLFSLPLLCLGIALLSNLSSKLYVII